MLDELGVVDRRSGHDVELAYDLPDRQVLERCESLIERLDGRGQAGVELMPDDVDRDAPVEQVGYQRVQAGALIGPLCVVIVDDQSDRARDPGSRILDVECLVRPVECIIDVRRTEDVVVRACAQPIWCGRV